MRKSFLLVAIVFVTCLVLAMLAPAPADAYTCTFDSTLTVVYYPGYGDTCAGYGSGCTYCSSGDGESAESCVAEGFTNCFAEEHQTV